MALVGAAYSVHRRVDAIESQPAGNLGRSSGLLTPRTRHPRTHAVVVGPAVLGMLLADPAVVA